MNIIYFGSDVFFDCFRYLLSSGQRVLALYTYHSDGEYICEERVTALAREMGVPVVYDRLSELGARRMFENGTCDLFFSAEYDKRIPVPDVPNFRGVNIHNSLLPQGRGYFPIEMRLYYGYDYGGVTMHKLADRIDQGDILLQKRFDIAPEDDDRALYSRCASLALQMTKEFIAGPTLVWQRARKQIGGGEYWKMPTKEQVTVAPDMTIERIAHTYRAMGRLTVLKLNGTEYKVESLKCAPGGPGCEGEIFSSDSGRICFRAQGGSVSVELQRHP